MKILVVDDSREDRDLVITHIKQSEGKKKIIIDESSCLTDAFKKININPTSDTPYPKYLLSSQLFSSLSFQLSQALFALH